MAEETEAPRSGDIGPVRREITFEPLPDEAPVEVPEPEKVPA